MTSALAEVLEKLEPCPMCGGEAHLERQGHVACKTGWPCVHTAYFNWGTPEEQNAAAIRAWNTRPALLASQQYAEANPLGGPASMLETAARRIRAGEDFHEVLADYDLHSRAALLRDAGDGWLPIESAPQHKEVLVYIENAGVLLAQQTHLADVFASDAEIEALADDGMSEEEMFRICWWAYLPNGVVRMEDDCGNPTHWRPLPAPPAKGE